MSGVGKTDSAAVAETAPPVKSTTAKKPASKPNHPPTSEMVNTAISILKDKKGSSLPAIKKYIATNYLVDADKQSSLIRKYLKTAVEKNIIIQTKGTGANGRFKLAKIEKEKPQKKPAVKKSKETTKKSAVAKPKAEKVSKSTSPSKTRKTVKAPIAKSIAKAKQSTPSPKPKTKK